MRSNEYKFINGDEYPENCCCTEKTELIFIGGKFCLNINNDTAIQPDGRGEGGGE